MGVGSGDDYALLYEGSAESMRTLHETLFPGYQGTLKTSEEVYQGTLKTSEEVYKA